MGQNDERLVVLARHAYEMGRFYAATKVLVFVAPLITLALFMNESNASSVLAIGAVLAVVIVLLSFRGQTYGRAVVPGLMAGVMPLLLPLVAQSGGSCCMSGSCSSTCMTACVCGGLFAGIIVGLGASRQIQSPMIFAFSSAIIGALTGSLGCLHMGAAGIVGMLAALLISAAPVMVIARVRHG